VAKTPLHNGAGETNCVAGCGKEPRADSPRPRGHFVLAAGASAPGGLSGATGALLSAGGVPLSGVVLPLVAEPDGSMGGGVLEPPQATAERQAMTTKLKLKQGRYMGRSCAATGCD
jgi:hypothetical protein